MYARINLSMNRVLVFVFAYLRSTDSPIGPTCGDATYFTLFFANQGILLIFTFYIRRLLLMRSPRDEIGVHFRPDYYCSCSDRSAKKLEFGHEPLDGDLQWTPETTIQYPLMAVVAGVMAGLLGIGGCRSFHHLLVSFFPAI
jgi:hypothetical protein